MRAHKIEIPKIPEEEKTPIILQLLEIIEQQSETIILQAEENQQLKDQIARLKKQKPKSKCDQADRKRDFWEAAWL